MESLGARVSETARAGHVIKLVGCVLVCVEMAANADWAAPPRDSDIGVGKTVFARGFIRHQLRSPHETVTSPTFVLENVYEATPGGTPCVRASRVAPFPDALVCSVHHIDMYRLAAGNTVHGIDWGRILTRGTP